MLLCFRYEADELASSLDLELVTTSAKDNVNIDSVFQTIANSHFRTRIRVGHGHGQYGVSRGPSGAVSSMASVSSGWRHNRVKSSMKTERHRHRVQQDIARQQQVSIALKCLMFSLNQITSSFAHK